MVCWTFDPDNPETWQMNRTLLFSAGQLLLVLAFCLNVWAVNPNEVVSAMVQGDHETAETLARELLSTASPDEKIGARNLLGMVLGQAGNYEEAILLFQENIQEEPANAGAYANLGEALRRAGRPREALEPLQKTVELQPESILYALKLRLARVEAGEDEEIGEETARQLQQNPPPADWLITAAAIALHREKWSEAKILLEQAKATFQPQLYGELMQDVAFSRHAEQPELAGLFPKLEVAPAAGTKTLEAAGAYSKGEFSQALQLLQQAEKSDEAAGPIANVRGGVYMAQGDYPKAREEFRRALELAPGDVSLHLNYGESLRANGQSDEASQVFQRALQLDPENEFIAIKLSFTLVEAGQGAEVLGAGLKDLKGGPLLLGKAAAAASQGQMAEAAEFFQGAKDSMPPEVFAGILRDPVFLPYRDTPELSGFFPAAD